MNKIIYTSVIRCPYCGFEKEEKMPRDACQFFYKCQNCNKIIRPKKVTVVCSALMGQ